MIKDDQSASSPKLEIWVVSLLTDFYDVLFHSHLELHRGDLVWSGIYWVTKHKNHFLHKWTEDNTLKAVELTKYGFTIVSKQIQDIWYT